MNFSLKLALLLICTIAENSQSFVVIDPLQQEEISGIIHYEKSTHMQFTVLTPFSKGNQPPVLVVEKELCPQTSGQFYCTLISHLEAISLKLISMITLQQTISKEESTVPNLSSSCDKIGQFFPSLFTNNENFVESRQALRKCLEVANLTEEFVVDYLDGYNYVDNYEASLTSYDFAHRPIDPETQRSSMIVQEMLNIGGFVHHLAAKMRWEDAISKCKLQKILPSSLITSEMLAKNLQDISEKSALKGYELAIPTDPESISAYWTLPTVDCTFSGSDAALNIIMAVPLKKSGREWSLHRLIPIPFHRTFEDKGYVCFQREDEQFLSFERSSRKSYGAGEPDGILQHVSKRQKGFLVSSKSKTCEETLMSGDALPIDITTNCKLKCEEDAAFDPSGLGIIVQASSSDTFYIAKTNRNTTSVGFQCPGGYVSVNLPENGATKVRAGCGCYVVGELDIEVEIPCESGFDIESEEVRPVHFQGSFSQ